MKKKMKKFFIKLNALLLGSTIIKYSFMDNNPTIFEAHPNDNFVYDYEKALRYVLINIAIDEKQQERELISKTWFGFER